MGVTKKMISPGNGVDRPKAGDTITMEYTGNLYDPNKEDHKGDQYGFDRPCTRPRLLNLTWSS
jgi:FK506-binding protein 1